jgi:hypothetical protein
MKKDLRVAADDRQQESFERSASRGQRGLLSELIPYLLHNKKWWLTPIILLLVLVGLMVIFAASSPVAPFIYTLF